MSNEDVPRQGLKKVVLKVGDLADSKVDAIVNAGNTWLRLGSGVSGAIGKKGGASIQQELDRLRGLRLESSIPQGEVVLTPGGSLHARHVIHAAVLGPNPVTDEVIVACLHSSVQCAERLECRSMAFPAIGTGSGMFPIDRCASLMADVLPLLLENSVCLAGIMIVLYKAEDLGVFESVFQEKQMRYRVLGRA